MRTRHATALSVAGVLAAGLVAALVNAQALAGPGGPVDRALGSTQLVGSSTSVASSDSTTINQRVFSVGEAGVVTLDHGLDTLSLLAVTPADGWSVSSVRSIGSDVIVIGFASSNSLLTAVASLRDSTINVTLATTALEGHAETTTSSTIASKTIPPDPTVAPMETTSPTPPIPMPTTERPPAIRPPSSQPISTQPISTDSSHAQPAPIGPASTQPFSTLATPSGAPRDGNAGHGSDHGATGDSVVPDD